MNNLVIMKDRQAVTDSLKVADTFEKEHRNVLKRARNLTAQNGAVEKNVLRKYLYKSTRARTTFDLYEP